MLAPDAPERPRVYVDLSHPESTSRLTVGFEDCSTAPYIGDLVDAVDLPGHREATGECVGVNERERVVSIAVDWATLRELPL